MMFDVAALMISSGFFAAVDTAPAAIAFGVNVIPASRST